MRFIKFSMTLSAVLFLTMTFAQTSKQHLQDLIDKIQNNIPVAGEKDPLGKDSFCKHFQLACL